MSMLLSVAAIVFFSLVSFLSMSSIMRSFIKLADKIPMAAGASIISSFITIPGLVLGLRYLYERIIPVAYQYPAAAVGAIALSSVIGTVWGLSKPDSRFFRPKGPK